RSSNGLGLWHLATHARKLRAKASWRWKAPWKSPRNKASNRQRRRSHTPRNWFLSAVTLQRFDESRGESLTSAFVDRSVYSALFATGGNTHPRTATTFDRMK